MLDLAVKGLSVQARVISAVILREIRTRFGMYHLGYLWAVLVPLMFVISLTVFFAFLGKRSAYGAPIELLLFSGMMAWLCFIDTQGHVSRAFQTNRQLLVYPMVTVVDIVIARSALEFGTKLAATAILAIIFYAAGIAMTLDDPLAVAVSMGAMVYFGATFGHIVGCALVVAPSIGFGVNAVRRLLFFTSGVLFALVHVPEQWRHYLLLNPLAHLIDLARGGWITGYSAPYADIDYVISWAIGMGATAAIMELAVRRRRGGAMR